MKFRLAPLLLISGAAIAASAHAGEKAAPAQPVDETTATAEFNGMKVAVDKKTGKLRPLTPAESRELDEMFTQQRQSARRGPPGQAALPETEAAAIATARTLPMGGTAMKLPESHMEYLTATRDADGNLVLSHSSDVGTTEELPHE